MVSDKGVWPRLRVREGFSEELMPEPRSERGEGDRRAWQGQRRGGIRAQGIAHAVAQREDDHYVLKEEKRRKCGVRGAWKQEGLGRRGEAHYVDFIGHMRDFGFCLRIKWETTKGV